MIGWLAAILTAVIAILVIAGFRRRTDQLLLELKNEQRDQVRLLEDEADAQVRRLSREASVTRNDARDALVKDLLPMFDSLNLAIESASDSDTARGIVLVLEDLVNALARHGLAVIDPDTGEAFDPEVHEAVEMVDAGEVDAGSVARTLRRGLRSPERVLRPALVAVARAPIEEPEAEQVEEPGVVPALD